MNPKYEAQPTTPEQTQGLLYLAFKGENSETPKDLLEIIESDFILQIIDKRIKCFSPEVELSVSAKIAISIFAQGNPGKAVVILIDILEELEKNNINPITLDFMIQRVYPDGFYSPEALEKRFSDVKNPGTQTSDWCRLW